MYVDGKQIDVGSIIEFRSMNNKDPGLKSGTVIGLVTFTIANMYLDVIKYHQEVNESITPNITTAPEDLLYFTITGPTSVTITAVDWVLPNSLTIIDVLSDIPILIHNTPITSLPTILKLLGDNGFNASSG